MSRWLRPWTPERAAANDWQLMYLDAYAAHMDKSIVDLAYERGYIVVYHGGCTTGICQVNDTDLHAQLERVYVELETQSFYQQQLVDPGNISRSRQQAPSSVFQLVGQHRVLERVLGCSIVLLVVAVLVMMVLFLQRNCGGGDDVCCVCCCCCSCCCCCCSCCCCLSCVVAAMLAVGWAL